MDSPFLYRLTLHQDVSFGEVIATWVSTLPNVQQLINQVVVIPSTVGDINPGMYVWDGSRWRYVLPYAEVAQAIIAGSTLDVFYNMNTEFSDLPPTVQLWRNGLPYAGDVVASGGNAVWTAISQPQAGAVSSVNGVTPDSFGNVALTASVITGFASVAYSGDYDDLLNKPAPYSLPVATASVLGGVKIGTGLVVADDGTISVTTSAGTVTSVNGITPDIGGNVTLPPYNLPIATSTVLGGVKQGSNITITPDGTISAVQSVYTLPVSTALVLGGVKIGANVTVAGDGTISVAAPYTLPVATASVLGGVKQGTNVVISVDGTISTVGAVGSVSGQTGTVVVKAVDNNIATGISLIADSGATTGTIKLSRIVQGSNITIAPDVDGNLVINSSAGVGSVQSVALALPSIFSVSGSPVTSTGTLTGTLAGQNANWVFAGPTSGSADIPAFRALHGADLPPATTGVLGAVSVGSGLAVTVGGVISNAGVTTFNTRSGAVVLVAADMVNQSTGAFIVPSPAFTGVPTAPTAANGTSTVQIATTAFVQAAITAFETPPATTSTLGGVIVGSGLAVNGTGVISNAGVVTFNTRSGLVTLVAGDLVDGSGKFLLSSPVFLGTPQADTAAPGTNTTQLATTAFVTAAVTAGSVTSFNTRTGPVTLQATDLQVGNVGSGAFILGSPVFTGIPAAPTAAPGTNTTQIATTAFVATQAALLAPLASPALTGTPTAPTATPGTNTTQIATTAFVAALVASSGVSTFNGRNGIVTLAATDLQVGGSSSGAFILGSPQFTGIPSTPTPAAPSAVSLQVPNLIFLNNFYAALASPTFTGTPTAPTATSGTSTTQIATTAFVAANFVTSVSPALTGTPTAPTAAPGTNTTQIATTAFAQALFSSLTLPPATTSTLGGVIVKSGLTVDGSGNLSANVTSVAGHVGVVVLTVSDISGAAPLASPALTGTPTAPTANVGDNTTNIATTSFVTSATLGTSVVTITGGHTLTAPEYGAPVIILSGTLVVNAAVTFPTTGKWSVVNNTSGAFTVTLQAGNGSGSTIVIPQGGTADVIANTNSLLFSGQLGITRALNDSTTYLATTAYVMNALGSLATGVTSFNTRTGAVLLVDTDLQVGGTGAFILGSPALTGIPTAPTAAPGNNSTQLATTAFVAASYAPLASPALSGTPTAPTATAGNNSTQVATTAFVATSFAPLASPTFTGTPAAPTAAAGTNSTQIATTAFVQRYLSQTTTVALTNANVTLTAAQYSNQIIEFTGALTASVIITVPTSGQWILYNNTTGAFNVTISNGSGSTYVAPQNESASVLSLVTLGIVNANIAGFTLTPATATTLGGVIVPNAGGLVVDVSGNISVSAATASVIGGVIIGAGLTITGSTVSANVTTVAGRTGAVVLAVADVSGAAPLASPTLTGVPLAPTATAGNSTTQIATTAFVATSFAKLASPTFTGAPLAPTAAVGTNTTQLATTAFVYSATQGSVTIPLTNANVTLTAAQYSVPIIILTGTLTANVGLTVPTTGEWIFYNLCTGAFTVNVSNGSGFNVVVPQSTSQATPLMSNTTNGIVQVLAASSGVASFNARTGVVVLTSADITSAGGAVLASPAFTGTPTSTTPTAGDNSTNIATTAFVATSFAPLASPALTGLPTAPTATAGTTTTQIATTAFVATSFAPLASPVLTGVPLVPTATLGANNTQIASTAYVYAATQSQVTVPLTNANVTLTAAQYSAPFIKFTGTLTGNVVITFPTTGNWSIYNATTGSFTVTLSNGTGATLLATQTASSMALSDATAGILSGGSGGSAVTSVAGRTGAVVLAVADVSGAAPLASPTFTGIPAAPTATAGTSTTQLATTAFVAVSYAPLASPALTGTPTAPTATVGTNSTQIATTAYVYAATQGQTIVALTNANVTLTAAQYSNPFIKFTGTLTGNVVITFPTTGNWNVYNSATGAFTVTLSNGLGSSLVIPSANSISVLSDSTLGIVSGTSSGGAVTSVAGRTGTIVLAVADVSGAAPLASPTLTGTPAAPTATSGTNTTQIATTAFVATAVAPLAPLASPTFTGRAQSPAYSFSTSALGSVSGTQTLNLGLFTEFTMTITAATTFAFTNTLASNISEVVFLKMTNAGAFTIAWPASTKFANKTAPTFTTSGVDLVGVMYDTDTATYMVFVVALNIG